MLPSPKCADQSPNGGAAFNFTRTAHNSFTDNRFDIVTHQLWRLETWRTGNSACARCRRVARDGRAAFCLDFWQGAGQKPVLAGNFYLTYIRRSSRYWVAFIFAAMRDHAGYIMEFVLHTPRQKGVAAKDGGIGTRPAVQVIKPSWAIHEAYNYGERARFEAIIATARFPRRLTTGIVNRKLRPCSGWMTQLQPALGARE